MSDINRPDIDAFLKGATSENRKDALIQELVGALEYLLRSQGTETMADAIGHANRLLARFRGEV